MKKYFQIMLIAVSLIAVTQKTAFAYTYGNPGEEKMAETYKQLESYLESDDWEMAKEAVASQQEEFDLYFQESLQLIEQGFEKKDKDLIQSAYQTAMVQNIERRLQFAEDQFDDYGQAKLLLAKARGTFNVLEPIAAEKESQEFVDEIYSSFDKALEALGNPGLFGVGKAESNLEAFQTEKKYIENELKPLFPMPGEKSNKEQKDFTEELNFMQGEQGNQMFWFVFALGLTAILIVLVILNIRKKRNKK
ncbi:hypothetical protein [Terrihalobacillus insolitus]|uniref:hypothetical protein n=1 Tax=Terrihalobacillus insolitus TaxID=2950438 RepID=UPI002340C463|nr:hypothetical protein [Terrihalobacillus insolitus]MDC3413206.1 hypothetical protein [Terrihalobacillus insolitus]